MFKKTLGAVLVTALIFSGCVSYVSTPLSVQESRLVTDAFGRQVEIPGRLKPLPPSVGQPVFLPMLAVRINWSALRK